MNVLSVPQLPVSPGPYSARMLARRPVRLPESRPVRYTWWSHWGGNNSVVECDLAKVEVAGSNPVSRSILRSRNRRASIGWGGLAADVDDTPDRFRFALSLLSLRLRRGRIPL